MLAPSVIDNVHYLLGKSLIDQIGQRAGKPFDIATANFSISGCCLVKYRLHHLGVFRLLLVADPQTDADLGLTPAKRALHARLHPLTIEPLRD